MTYREAKKVKCGSTLLRKSQNYKPTSVLEIIEDKDTHAIFFRCTDGLFYHDALCMPMPAEKLADIYLKSKNTQVYIDYNKEIGQWLYTFPSRNLISTTALSSPLSRIEVITPTSPLETSS